MSQSRKSSGSSLGPPTSALPERAAVCRDPHGRAISIAGTSLLVAIVLAGCGGGAATAAHPSAMSGAHGDNEPTFHFPRRATVLIRDDGFHPKQLKIRVNTTVSFVNRATRPHSVRWTRGRSPHFVSGPLAPNASFRIRFPHVAADVGYRSTMPRDGARFSGQIIVR